MSEDEDPSSTSITAIKKKEKGAKKLNGRLAVEEQKSREIWIQEP